MTASLPTSGLRVRASAKINLYLHVLGRRADGYHLIDSLVVFADVHDVLTVLPAADLTLEIDGPFAGALEPGRDNLVMRAATSLAAEAGVRDGAAMRLTKMLPVAAGLGGGSADAAAALKALSSVWRLEPPAARLNRIAEQLGADVPVCLHGETAFVGGIGERIEPAPALPEMGVLLVNPSVMVSTPEVYRAREGPFSGSGRFSGPLTDVRAVARLLEDRRNDLSDAARSIEPLIGSVLEALDGQPACLLSRLSGSGPTCFGLFEDEAAARAAGSRISAVYPGWWVSATRAPVAAGQPA